jgi:ribosomal protein S18 acetylase RimI-like enzyme
MSRSGLRRLLASPSAEFLVAQAGVAVAGVAIVLFRANSRVARLYSLAVAPEHTGRGIATALLARAETIARARRCLSLRLEVHENNRSAITVYGKAGYRQFGRHARYYADHGDALRFEKALGPQSL